MLKEKILKVNSRIRFVEVFDGMTSEWLGTVTRIADKDHVMVKWDLGLTEKVHISIISPII